MEYPHILDNPSTNRPPLNAFFHNLLHFFHRKRKTTAAWQKYERALHTWWYFLSLVLVVGISTETVLNWDLGREGTSRSIVSSSNLFVYPPPPSSPASSSATLPYSSSYFASLGSLPHPPFPSSPPIYPFFTRLLCVDSTYHGIFLIILIKWCVMRSAYQPWLTHIYCTYTLYMYIIYLYIWYIYTFEV